MDKGWRQIGMIGLLLAACVSAGMAEENQGFHANSFVFVGNKAGKVYTLILDLKLGVSPEGTIADYEGWFAIDGRWNTLASGPTRFTATNLDEVASVPPFEVQRLAGGGYRIAIKQGELKPITLQTEAFGWALPLGKTSRLSQVVSTSPAVLEFEGDKITGFVAHERVVQQGANPYRRDPENRYGRYERIVLFTPSGEGFLLAYDAGRLVRNPDTLTVHDFTLHVSPQGPQRYGPPAVKWTQTTYIMRANRDIPEEWTIELPELSLSGFLKGLGRYIEHGHIPGSRVFWLYGNFAVVGQLTLRGEKHVVWGVVQHVQEDESRP